MIFPSDITRIWSASFIVFNLWAMTRSVLFLHSSEIASCIARSLSASTLAVASSKITMGESFRIHLAMESLCFSPPGKRCSAFPDYRIKSFWKRHNKVITSCLLCSLNYFFPCSIRSTNYDIVVYRVLKKINPSGTPY